MRLTRLDVQNLRCLAEVRFEPVAGLNLVTGGNGAGKTSLVEAMHLLGYGRSFRGRVRDGLIRTGSPNLELYAEWLDGQGRTRRAGLRHGGSDWEARLDEKGSRHLLGREATDHFQRQRRPAVGGNRRMATDEDQLQPLVGNDGVVACQPIHALVFRVAVVGLDPMPADVMPRGGIATEGGVDVVNPANQADQRW